MEEMYEADFLLLNAGQLLTMAPEIVTEAEGLLGIVEDAAIAALEGTIVWVGESGAAEQTIDLRPGATTVDAGGRVVLPGFVDAHTHPVFAGDRAGEFYERALRDTVAQASAYVDQATSGRGIMSTVRATRAASEETLIELARERARTFLRYGTTTIEAKSGYGLEAEAEIKSLRVLERLRNLEPLKVVSTFLGPHAIPEEYAGRAQEYMDTVIEDMLPRAADLATFADVWCEDVAFSYDESRRYLEAARARGLLLKLHGDELADSGGGRLAAEVGARTADHLIYIDDDAIGAMAAAGVVAVLLPATCFFLGGAHYAPARKFLEAGVEVALATDFNPGTSPTQNMQLVLTLAVEHLGMTPEESLLAATRGGARALAREDSVGSLEPGKSCDLLVCDVDDYLLIPYYFGVNHVETVVTDGAVVKERGAAYAGVV